VPEKEVWLSVLARLRGGRELHTLLHYVEKAYGRRNEYVKKIVGKDELPP